MGSQVKAFLPAGEEEGKEVTAADLKVGLLSMHFFLQKTTGFLNLKRKVCHSRSIMLNIILTQGTVQSPQFQQAVSMFSMALQSGQIAPLVNQYP